MAAAIADDLQQHGLHVISEGNRLWLYKPLNPPLFCEGLSIECRYLGRLTVDHTTLHYQFPIHDQFLAEPIPNRPAYRDFDLNHPRSIDQFYNVLARQLKQPLCRSSPKP